jgi:hypothetical protein
VPVDDGPEGLRKGGMGLDGVEFAGFDQGRDGCPVCGTCIVAREENTLSFQRDGADGALEDIVIHLDPTGGEEEAKASPVLCNVFQCLAQRGFGGHAGAVAGQPCLEVGDL